MEYPPPWNGSEPPKDRPLLTLAFAKGTPDLAGSVDPVRVVAAWVSSDHEWRPVKVGRDTITGIDLNVICWTDIPDAPAIWWTMPETQQEAEWRSQFERIGEEQAYTQIHTGIIPEPMRQFGFRWLGEQAKARKQREADTFRYVKLTLWAAVAAVLVGVIGVAVTWFHK
jgi:hypothetical protein